MIVNYKLEVTELIVFLDRTDLFFIHSSKIFIIFVWLNGGFCEFILFGDGCGLLNF